MTHIYPDNIRRCKFFSLKKLSIFLLISPILMMLYAVLKTQIQVAVFSVASTYLEAENQQTLNSYRRGLLISKDSTAVYRERVNTAARIKTTTDMRSVLNAASLEKGTAEESTVASIKTSFVKQEINDTSDLQYKANDGATAVILLTYMRSGSSLTGDILQQPEDAFYVFEPLKNAYFISSRKRPIHFINGTLMVYGSYDLQRVYEETLYGWLSCDFSRIYAESLLDFGFMSFGRKFTGYEICLKRVNVGQLLITNSLHESKQFMECLEKLRQICMHSKFRIVKTIRSKMDIAKSVFNRIPNSKILHLIRDPRATIESQRHRGRCRSGITKCIAKHCENVRHDSTVKQIINSVAPERIRNVLYEDIAGRPIITAQKMYSFIGMEFTEEIANYAYSITLGKDKSRCKVCTVRWQIGKSDTSSETHIAAWKEKFPGIYINQTQILCKDIIKNYGYEYYIAPPEALVVKKVKRAEDTLRKLIEMYKDAHSEVSKTKLS